MIGGYIGGIIGGEVIETSEVSVADTMLPKTTEAAAIFAVLSRADTLLPKITDAALRDYLALALAIFAAFTTPPTTARKEIINNVVADLVLSGVWNELDVLHVYAAADSQAALINWKSPGTFNGTLFNAPAFAADRGFTGNGSNAYISTGYTPDGSLNYKLTDAMGGIFVLSRDGEDKADIGVSAGGHLSIFARDSTHRIQVRVNDTTNLIGLSGYVKDASGFLIATRTGTDRLVYKNGRERATGAGVSATGLPTSPIYALRNFSAYSSKQLAALVLGGHLSAVQAAALHEAVAQYMEEVEAYIDPDRVASRARDAWGVLLDDADYTFTYFQPTEVPPFEIYEKAFGDLGDHTRTTLDAGEKGTGDPATTERAELDTLGDFAVLLGTQGKAAVGIEFDVWVPFDIPLLTGMRNVIGQINVTSESPAFQLGFGEAGTLQARLYHITDAEYLNEGAIFSGSTFLTMEHANATRGQWHRIRVEALWSKAADGQLRVYSNGVLMYERLNQANLGASVSAASSLYLKLGDYRTGTPSLHASRIQEDIFHRRVSVVTQAVPFTGADTLLPMTAEAAVTLTQLDRADTLLPMTVETVAALFATLARADTVLPMTADAAAILGTLARADTLLPMVSEASGFLALLDRTDTLLPKTTETAALFATLTRADTLAPMLSDSAAIFATVARADTLSPMVTDTAAVLAILARVDTLLPMLSETPVILAALARADTLLPMLTEGSATILATLARTDALTLTLGEAVAILARLDRADGTAITLTEAAALLAILARTDGLAPLITDAATVQDILDFFFKSVSDTLLPKSTEAATVLGLLALSDTAPVALAEAVAIFAVLSRADAFGVTIADVAALVATLAATDTLRPAVNEVPDADTMLLLHFTGPATAQVVKDASRYARELTAFGNWQFEYGLVPFGSGSLGAEVMPAGDGDGTSIANWLTNDAQALLTLDGGAFKIENGDASAGVAGRPVAAEIGAVYRIAFDVVALNVASTVGIAPNGGTNLAGAGFFSGGAVGERFAYVIATATTLNISIRKVTGEEASLALDGTGDYVRLADEPAFTYAGDFTIDAWVRADNLTNQTNLYTHRTDNNNYTNIALTTAGRVQWRVQIGGVQVVQIITGVGSVVADTWYHLAVVRRGNGWRIYLNGAVAASATVATALPDFTGPIEIGAFNGSGNWAGWIDEFRVSNVARWTDNFVPPGPYPAAAVLALLARTDALPLTFTEAAAILTTLAAADAVGVSVTDMAAILARLDRTDLLAVVLGDAAAAATIKEAADALAIVLDADAVRLLLAGLRKPTGARPIAGDPDGPMGTRTNDATGPRTRGANVQGTRTRQ
jgi:hypothetical protein